MKLTEKFKERIEEIKKECGYIYPLTANEMDELRYTYEHARSLANWKKCASAFIKRLREEH